MPLFEMKRPDWERDGKDWPNRDASRFVEAADLRWHVQEFGSPRAPAALLIHGTGAATHSWRALAPILARRFRVVAPDLPGHGFTDPLAPSRLTLPGTADALAGLLGQLDVQPRIALGHAAGAAILMRMCLDGSIDPSVLICVNGALKPVPGAANVLFPSLSRALFRNSVMPKFLAWSAGHAVAQKFLDGMGKRIDRDGLDLYKRLLARSGHVAGALGMMANWDLGALDRDLPRLTQAVVLVTGQDDKAILPETANHVRERLANARVASMSGLGHLAHEEAPERIAALMLDEARLAGVLTE